MGVMQARVMREIWGGEPHRALKKFTNNSKLLTEIKELPAVGKIPGKRINRLSFYKLSEIALLKSFSLSSKSNMDLKNVKTPHKDHSKRCTGTMQMHTHTHDPWMAQVM